MNGSHTPKDFLGGLKENWKNDILSGFSIFLIALPLCIGIAIASGAPATAGIYAGIIGGIVVSLISGSYVTINGPAAGLIVIVLSSIEKLGGGNNALGFQYTLAAIVCCGLIQIVMGLIRAGDLASLFPTSVIHGMLAAIGIIIFVKQFHVLLGVETTKTSVFDLLSDMPYEIIHLNPYVTIIGLVSVAIIVGMNYIKNEKLKKIPAALVVVVVGIILQKIFDFDSGRSYEYFGNTYHLGNDYLVKIPENFFDGINHPDFSVFYSKEFGIQVFAITMVASLESLLTVSAIDRLDPYKRESNMNTELIAKGVGNTVLGLIGGIPIIAEVVRSSANISNGAKTRWSNFFHGIFLLLFLLILPDLIRMTPITCLSALLMVVGVRLSIPEFKKMYSIGMEKFIIFLVTIYFTLADDLLVGVGFGVATRFIINFLNMYLPKGVAVNDIFVCNLKKIEFEDEIFIKVIGVAFFTNILKLKKTLRKLPKGKNVKLDLSEVYYVDSTVLTNLLDFRERYESLGGKFALV
ncbi:MAG: SulP family inorganic anion transporter, partial [Leptospiraceae bacterium]|nr:SulP family inorganic anion transporter [Leptospiraceae bacterium]